MFGPGWEQGCPGNYSGVKTTVGSPIHHPDGRNALDGNDQDQHGDSKRAKKSI